MADAPQQKTGGLFSGKPAGQPQTDVQAIQSDLNAVSARARLAEERTADMQRRIQFLEQQMLANHKKLANELKLVRDDISDVKRSNSEVQNKIIMLIKELQLTARKEDIDVIRKYIDLWEPVNFVGAIQARKIVKDELSKAGIKPADELPGQPDEQ